MRKRKQLLDFSSLPRLLEEARAQDDGSEEPTHECYVGSVRQSANATDDDDLEFISSSEIAGPLEELREAEIKTTIVRLRSTAPKIGRA